jgi:hypothetical protein
MSIEEALGAAPSLRAASMQRGRDDALHRLARRFPGLSDRALAKAVRNAVTRHEASAAWRKDGAAGRRPDAAAGDCYDILVHGGVPGCDRLRQILG